MMRSVVLVCVVVAGSASYGRAETIWDQQPTGTGGVSADTEFVDDLGRLTWELEADNILLTTSATVRQLTWWGLYGGNFSGSPDPPVGDEWFRIRFYAPRGGDGLPDDANILSEQFLLNPTRVYTGRDFFGGSAHEFLYEAPLNEAFFLASDTLYWLEIVQFGDVESHFRWEFGSGALAGRAFVNPVVSDWRFVGGNFAFQLSSVPEPGTIWLVFAVVPFLISRHRGGW